MRLANKTALVTGAASGIGKAVVGAFRREGAEVFAADIDYSGTASGADDDGHAVCLDVSSESDWERLTERLARLDVLVACAGISEARPIPETSLGDWRRVMNVNLDGAFLSVKYGAQSDAEERRRGHRARRLSLRNQGVSGSKCVLHQQGGGADVGQNSRFGIQVQEYPRQLRVPGSGGYTDVAKDAILA